MMLLVERYGALDGNGDAAPFVWYLADAPELALRRAFGPEFLAPRRIGSALLDIAIVHSQAIESGGRISLHAASTQRTEAGRRRLYDWYSIDRGMRNFPGNKRLPSGMFRQRLAPNDGRYFYYAEEDIESRLKEFDGFR